MRSRPDSNSGSTRVVVLTGDETFRRTASATFDASSAVDLVVVPGPLAERSDTLDVADATVVVLDIDASRADELEALSRLTARVGRCPPIIAIIQGFDESVARTLMQLHVADFLVKPVSSIALVRACAAAGQRSSGASAPNEATIYTFLPAVGGAGVTTLAVQTAMLLLNSGGPRAKPSTCIVDLNFQNGAVADYLDLEPRLNLAEIEPRPDRLDRQLLEVMLSYHASGLAVVAAPNQPAEMRSFDPDFVTRLLDLVASNFKYVVLDMPRTWFSWTDSVLLGSNKLYVVSETTVPGLRHAKQLVAAITERLTDAPAPTVIVNRFQQSMFSSSLRLNDIQRALGETPVNCIPNDYALVREAIDRGVPLNEVKPGNKIVSELKRLVLDRPSVKPVESAARPPSKKLKLFGAR